jgi:hypothetical protein
VGLLRARLAREKARPEPFPGHERYIAPVRGRRVPPIVHEPVTQTAEPAKPRAKTKKKQGNRLQASRSEPMQRASRDEPPPRDHQPPVDEPLFRTGHWIALLVIAPLIFAAFVLVSRWMGTR